MTKEELKEKAREIELNVRNWCNETSFKAKEFWNENKREIVTIAPIAGSLLLVMLKQARVDHNHAKEQDLKDLYIYDRSAGHYWPLRRKLKSYEWVEIDSRRANGERLYDILLDMRVLG